MSLSRPIIRTASSVPYDNTTSGLTASDVQAALDEIVASNIDGSGGATQIAYFSDANTLTSEAAFAYIAGTDTLNVRNIQADSGQTLSIKQDDGTTIFTHVSGNSFTNLQTALRIDNDVDYQFGTGGNAMLRWFTTGTNDALHLATHVGAASQSGNIIITTVSNRAQDHDHGTTANPTLYVHSGTAPDTANDQWVSFSHNQTDATISVGAGDLEISAAQVRAPNGSNLVIARGDGGAWATIDSTNKALIGITTNWNDDVAASFGGANTDSLLLWSTGQTNNALLLALGVGSAAQSGNFVITTYNNRTKDHDHASTTNPTLFIQRNTDPDVDNTQWGSLYHNGNFNLESGGGSISLIPASTAVLPGTVTNTVQFGSSTIAASGVYTRLLQADSGQSLVIADGQGSARLTFLDSNTVQVNSSLRFLDAVACQFGSSIDATLTWNTSQTNDSLVVGLGTPGDATGSGVLMVVDQANVGGDYAVGIEAHPMVKLFSNTAAGTSTAQWMSLQHDSNHGWIETGTGDLILNPAGNLVRPSTTNDISLGVSTVAFAGVYTRILRADDSNTFNLQHAGGTAVLTVGSGAARADLSAQVAYTNDISPSALAAQTNNWNPTGLSTASRIRATMTGNQTLTGLQGGADGRIMFIHNVDTADTLTIANESASSTAANRFLTGTGADLELLADATTLAIYDSTSSRWRLLGGGGGTGGAGISGTPANNQIAVWVDDSNIEGTSDLLWDGGQFTVTDGSWSDLIYTAISGTLEIDDADGAGTRWNWIVDMNYNTVSPSATSTLNTYTTNSASIDRWIIDATGSNTYMRFRATNGLQYLAGNGNGTTTTSHHQFASDIDWSIGTAGEYSVVSVQNQDFSAVSTVSSPAAAGTVQVYAFAAGDANPLRVDHTLNGNAVWYSFNTNVERVHATNGTVGYFRAQDDGTTQWIIGWDGLLQAISHDPGAVGVSWETYHLSASPLANDAIFRWQYYGDDSTAVKTEYARFEVTAPSVTNTLEHGAFVFSPAVSGSLVEYLRIDGNATSVVINDGGAAVSTRMETDTLDYAFFLDGSSANENLGLLHSGAPGWSGGKRIIAIGPATTEPTSAPAAGEGAFLWVNTTSDEIKARTEGQEEYSITRGVAKAWVRFNGTGTVAIDDDQNVASITDNGTGDYTINIENDMANADYCYTLGGRNSSTNPTISSDVGANTAGALTVLTLNRSGTAIDCEDVCAAIFGDLAA